MEHEAALERKKLMAEHQRRIQDELARKKTEAMNNYLDALADDEPDVCLLSQLPCRTASTMTKRHKLTSSSSAVALSWLLGDFFYR